MGEAQRQDFLDRFTEDGEGVGFAVLGGAFGEGIDSDGRAEFHCSQTLIACLFCGRLLLLPFFFRRRSSRAGDGASSINF